MQNRQNLSQILLGPFTKFGGKVQNTFETQSFGHSKILNHFILLMNEIFGSERISH
jgi:hypothetical protein